MTQSENENDHFDLDHFDHTCKELKECMEYKECKTDVSNDKTIVLYYLKKFEKYASASKDGLSAAVERLRTWFEEMPHVQLHAPKDHESLAETLSYMGVSRRELYDVYAAVLLLEKYGNATDHKAEEVIKVTEEIAMAMQPYVEAGLLGEDLQPKGISNPEVAYRRVAWLLRSRRAFLMI